MISQYDLEPVLIQRILIGFEARLEQIFSSSQEDVLSFPHMYYIITVILRDKTMDDKLMFFSNDDNQNYPFCSFKSLKTFQSIQLNEYENVVL